MSKSKKKHDSDNTSESSDDSQQKSSKKSKWEDSPSRQESGGSSRNKRKDTDRSYEARHRDDDSRNRHREDNSRNRYRDDDRRHDKRKSPERRRSPDRRDRDIERKQRSRSRDRQRDRKDYSDRNRNERKRSRDRNWEGNRNRRRRDDEEDNGNYEWGKRDGKHDPDAEPQEKDKPNFGLSGKLTEETNKVHGIVIKYAEPPEAKKPKRRWRLYPFKGETALPVLYIHRQSGFLIGRDRKICDIAVDHPSCSKQHAALQFRLVPYEREDGSAGKRVRPYIIDLESANGTFVNNKQIEAKKYIELLEKDVIKFGFSSREYVLLHESSKEEAEGDDNAEEDDNEIEEKEKEKEKEKAVEVKEEEK